MAVPSVRNVGAVASGQGDITPTLPTYAENDILVWVVHSTNRTFNTEPPSGLTLCSNMPAGLGTADAAGACKLHVYWKRATASESAVTFDSNNTGGAQVGRCMSIQGCITSGDPWDVSANTSQSSASTSLSFPSVTTTVADCLIVLAAAFDRDAGTTANLPALTNANLSSITERMDNLITTNAGGGIGAATGEKASAGSTGTTTGTITSSIYLSWTGALKPPVGGPTQYDEINTYTGAGAVALARVVSYQKSFSPTGAGGAVLTKAATFARAYSYGGTAAVAFSKGLVYLLSKPYTGTGTGALARQTGFVRSYSYGGTGALGQVTKLVGKPRIFTGAGTPAIAKGVARAATFSGAAAVSFSKGLVSLISRAFSGTGAVTSTRVGILGVARTYAGTAVVALTKRIGKGLSYIGTGTGALTRRIGLVLDSVGTASVALTRTSVHSLSQAFTGIGTLAAQESFIPGSFSASVIRFRRTLYRYIRRR